MDLRRASRLRRRWVISSRLRIFLSSSDEEAQEPELELLPVQLFNNLFFHGHLLKDSQAEALRYATISAVHIPSDNLKDLLQDGEVVLRRVGILTS